jgi:hypothetical protein
MAVELTMAAREKVTNELKDPEKEGRSPTNELNDPRPRRET